MLQITVYKTADAFRVVAGAHTAHADSKRYQVTVYADAPLAYTAETNPAIREAIARIAPEAAQFIAPLPPIKKVSLSRAIFGPTKNLPHKDLADAERTPAYAAGFNDADIEHAQNSLDTQPRSSAYWDTRRAQDDMEVIDILKLKPRIME